MNPWKEKREIGNATLYLGDCLEILPILEKVDAVITDPPYSERTHKGSDAISNGFGKDGADRKELGYSFLSWEDVRAFSAHFANKCDGWIVWMCDHFLSVQIQAALEDLDRYVFAPLPYYAPGSRTRLGGDGPACWTIWIMVARTRALHKWGTLPGGYIAGPGWREREKMGGKPVKLMERLVSDYSKSGDIVCDPCMGYGSTGVAALNLNRRFVGIEIVQSDFELACERIDQAQRQQRLFT